MKLEQTKYFYTFGTKGQPYRGGWVVVVADTWDEADEKFTSRFPLEDGLIKCAFRYTEDAFLQTPMCENGNFGAFCHEVIE